MSAWCPQTAGPVGSGARGRADAGVLNEVLGHIAFYCNEHGLPPLTAIVVGKGRGTPGENIPIDQSTLDKQREEVYEYDWYDVYPPSSESLTENECESFQEVADHIPRGSKHEREVTA